jgi:hypothetical protein
MRTPFVMVLALGLAACAEDSPEASNPAAYIRGTDFDRLVIELDGVTGRGPRAGVVDRLTAGLAALLDKPGGITVVRDEDLAASGPDRVWAFSELDTLARERFGGEVASGAATFHTMWLDGEYENPNVLGVAWANRFLVLFADRIDAGCARPIDRLEEALCQEAEVAIWTHEVGHVIGLVNNGIPIVEDHEDAERPGHTIDEDGVMYWAYEGANVFSLIESRLDDGDGLEFGPASRADVAAFRDAE